MSKIKLETGLTQEFLRVVDTLRTFNLEFNSGSKICVLRTNKDRFVRFAFVNMLNGVYSFANGISKLNKFGGGLV